MKAYEVTWTITHIRIIEADSKQQAIEFSQKMGYAGLEATQNGHVVPQRVGASPMTAKEMRGWHKAKVREMDNA